ncbi:S8 family serine peptidase [Pigmentibacter sp. JX0631]|uniref:S8 family peptidase n=1 Tax=Pigmentibacter sp. JX0631 TaxID=2976982 RepID=UPI002469BF71|nr:S8 family serine peptidase [Pigmentibacter sp. JX0631]WGL60946.1 S8 family serine peptidase [Pigmentibacter sp. JX0631]
MIKYLFIFFVFSVYSCSKFTINDDKILTTSDGSYVIETGLNDLELLSYGKEVIYRFKTVPNMIAVKSINMGKNDHNFIYLNSIYKIPESNEKKRPYFNNLNSSLTTTNSCFNAYCEANFDKALSEIQTKNLNLYPIKVAIVDSGVIPSTYLIKNNLVDIINLTNDENKKNWASHATYIASIFTGTVEQSVVKNIYAKNSKISSLKITFSDDPDANLNKNYGSMQLAVAMDYAVYLGAKLVNLSLSYTEKPDPNVELAEKIIISQAAKSNVLFLVAAGNESTDLQQLPVYPASYNLNNIITVGSHSSYLSLASSSNYGDDVDISAQASLIELNNKNGELEFVSGTSFAAPLVGAALSLYFGIFPSANINRALTDLFSSANNAYSSYYGVSKKTKYGRLDVKAFIDSGFKNN